MTLEGVFTINVPLELLFDFVLRPDTILSCLPGAESVVLLSDNTYECVVKQKVGPISVKLKFVNELTKIDRPVHLEIDGKGQDMTKLGHFTQKAVVDLKEVSPGEVEVSYQSHVNIVGKLAMFGDRIMRAKAKEIEREFTQNLRQRLSAEFAQ